MSFSTLGLRICFSKLVIFSFAIVVGALGSHAQAQLTWDPDGDNVSNGGAGTWDTTTANWGGGTTVWDNTGAQAAEFGDSGAQYIVDLATGITVGDLNVSSGTGNVILRSLTDNDAITVRSGGATWNTGGRELVLLNNQANDTALNMTSGDTLTITGGGTFNTGEKPNGADWVVAGATLDVGAGTILKGNTGSVGQFATVKLGADSTYIHERNANQGYANDWELGGGTITFSNRFANNGHTTLNGSVSGNADELVVDMNNGSRILTFTEANTSFTADTFRIADGQVNITNDNAISNSVLAIGGIAGRNARFNMLGNDQTIKGLFSDPVGNTREIRNNTAGSTSTLTIDVDAGANGGAGYSYVANVNGGGTIDIVKTGAGKQTFARNGGYSSAFGTVTVSAGELVWNNNNGSTISGPMTVETSGTLSGNGVIGSTLTVDAGGFLAPGVSAIGVLTADGNADIDGTMLIELDGAGGGSQDMFVVGGALDITGSSVDFSVIGSTLDDTAYIFASYGSLTGTFAIDNTPAGYVIDYMYMGNNIALVAAVPEPGSIALLGMFGLTIMSRRRRA